MLHRSTVVTTLVIIALLALVVAACTPTPSPAATAAPSPASVEETVEVTRIVEVTKVVEKTVQIVVTSTPAPPTAAPTAAPLKGEITIAVVRGAMLDFMKPMAEKFMAAQPGAKVNGALFWNEALAWGGWYWNMLQPIYLNANQNACNLMNRIGSDVVFDQPECKLAEFFTFARQAQQYAPLTMEQNFFSRSIGMWLQYGRHVAAVRLLLGA